jgi:hypothetical protein
MAEQILALKRSPDLRAAMAARGRGFALKNFSREFVLKTFDKIVSSIS